MAATPRYRQLLLCTAAQAPGTQQGLSDYLGRSHLMSLVAKKKPPQSCVAQNLFSQPQQLQVQHSALKSSLHDTIKPY
jgi:hypothetical protein